MVNGNAKSPYIRETTAIKSTSLRIFLDIFFGSIFPKEIKRLK